MSKRINEMFLVDLLIAIVKIEQVVTKLNNINDLLHSFTDWDSVIRQFEIIGESAKNCIKNQILSTDFQIVVDFRNKIIHNYFGIDEDAVWDVIITDLPELKEQIISRIVNYEDRQNILLSLKAARTENELLKYTFVVDALNDLLKF